MLPEEEPEQQLLEVTPAQIAEHQAAKKAVAGKAASSGTTGGLGGFAAAGAAGTGAGKATSHGAKKKVPDAATCLSNGASSSGANEPSMSAVADISQAQRRKLQVEKQYMQGKHCTACKNSLTPRYIVHAGNNPWWNSSDSNQKLLWCLSTCTVQRRWLGGMLTKWKTISKSISQSRPILKQKTKKCSNLFRKNFRKTNIVY